MRGSGPTLSSSKNGGSQRVVEESDYFKLRVKKLEPHVPRIREILRILHRQLAHNAELGARNLGEGGPGSWVIHTNRGEGAPELWVYFTLSPGRCRLEYLVLADGEPPNSAQDMTVL